MVKQIKVIFTGTVFSCFLLFFSGCQVGNAGPLGFLGGSVGGSSVGGSGGGSEGSVSSSGGSEGSVPSGGLGVEIGTITNPEPGSVLLLGSGLLAMAMARKKRRSQRD